MAIQLFFLLIIRHVRTRVDDNARKGWHRLFST